MIGFESDADFAKYLAHEAGKILLDLQKSGKFEGKELGKAGDSHANAFLISEIKKYRPNDAILSEEEKDNLSRLNASRVWIIDPLDGTREYSEGRGDWAVHIGLAIDKNAALGAVALPGMDLILESERPLALKAENSPLKMLVSRTRPAKEALEIAQFLGAELLPMGSAGAKAMAVVRGEADIYLHSGGQYEWDNCAPVAIAAACGLHVSRIDGSPLVYNCEDVYLPDLLICHKHRAQEILDRLKN